MDVLSELECLVGIVEHSKGVEITVEEAERWVRLFRFDSVDDAVKTMAQWRTDLSRVHVSDYAWDQIAAEKEVEGYDRESYEYSLVHLPTQRAPRAHLPTRGDWIIKMEGPLSLNTIRVAARLSDAPQISYSTDSGDGQGRDTFVTVNGIEKAHLLNWIDNHATGFQPTIVRSGKAGKQLDAHSIAPTLGVDITLPQFRASSNTIDPSPLQDNYPVRYFFYGTLVDPKVLIKLLELPSGAAPILRPASITGGRIGTWGGKYKAMVDDFTGAVVHGHTYLVESKELEDALRFYETNNYDVVRCEISVDGRTVSGLTFRFAGEIDC